MNTTISGQKLFCICLLFWLLFIVAVNRKPLFLLEIADITLGYQY
jgi:hypothetical protein